MLFILSWLVKGPIGKACGFLSAVASGLIIGLALGAIWVFAIVVVGWSLGYTKYANNFDNSHVIAVVIAVFFIPLLIFSLLSFLVKWRIGKTFFSALATTFGSFCFFCFWFFPFRDAPSWFVFSITLTAAALIGGIFGWWRASTYSASLNPA